MASNFVQKESHTLPIIYRSLHYHNMLHTYTTYHVYIIQQKIFKYVEKKQVYSRLSYRWQNIHATAGRKRNTVPSERGKHTKKRNRQRVKVKTENNEPPIFFKGKRLSEILKKKQKNSGKKAIKFRNLQTDGCPKFSKKKKIPRRNKIRRKSQEFFFKMKIAKRVAKKEVGTIHSTWTSRVSGTRVAGKSGHQSTLREELWPLAVDVTEINRYSHSTTKQTSKQRYMTTRRSLPSYNSARFPTVEEPQQPVRRTHRNHSILLSICGHGGRGGGGY